MTSNDEAKIDALRTELARARDAAAAHINWRGLSEFAVDALREVGITPRVRSFDLTMVITFAGTDADLEVVPDVWGLVEDAVAKWAGRATTRSYDMKDDV